jgi:hypothetical protein
MDTYVVTLQLLDVETGAISNSVSERCDGAAGLLEAAVAAARGLLGVPAKAAEPEPEPAELVLRCSPPATAEIDGTVRGETPLTIAGLKPASHTVIFRKEGYQPRAFTIAVKAGHKAVLDKELSPVVSAPVAKAPATGGDTPNVGTVAARGTTPSVRWMPIVGWTAIALGAGSVVTGGVVAKLSQDDRGALDKAATLEEKNRLNDDIATKRTAAVVLFAGGGGLAAVGAVLLIIDAARDGKDVEAANNIDGK